MQDEALISAWFNRALNVQPPNFRLLAPAEP